MSDSDNFGSDLESDCFGSHLGAAEGRHNSPVHELLAAGLRGAQGAAWKRHPILSAYSTMRVPPLPITQLGFILLLLYLD